MFLAPIAAFGSSYLLSHTAEQGLAHVMGLHTYRHGTDLISWIGVRILGGLPSKGRELPPMGIYGKPMDCRNRFYLATDSAAHSPNERSRIWMRILPKAYTVSRSWNLLKADAEKLSRTGLSFCGYLALPFHYAHFAGATLIGMVTPTLKFRLTPEKVALLKDDTRIGAGYAAYSESWLHPLNIGIIGTIFNSLHYRTPYRMFKDPARVLTGALMVGASLGVAYGAVTLFPAVAITFKVSLIAGAIFGIL